MRKDASICGSISAITTHNFTPGALTVGVLEGMVSELYDLYRRMGVKKAGLVGSGNGVRKNPHFIRLAEKRFGVGLRIPAHVEEAACGAALFAAVAAGIFKDGYEARRWIRYAT